jgi:glutaredoxin
MNNASHQRRRVTLYVVSHCPLCSEARRWLDSHQVAYLERDVAQDFGALRAMYKLTRQGLVPVFEFEGRALVRPHYDELKQLLFSAVED